jgi:hypothetical protein
MTKFRGPNLILTVPTSATEDILLGTIPPSFHKDQIEAHIRRILDSEFPEVPHIRYEAVNQMLEIRGTVFNPRAIDAVIFLHKGLDDRTFTVHTHLNRGRAVLAVRLPDESTEKVFTGKDAKSVRKRIRRFLRSRGLSITDSHIIPAISNHLGADIIAFD